MKTAFWVLVGFAICGVGVCSYVMHQYPTYSWNQKLVVTVTTPEGDVSGSSIVGVSWERTVQILPDMPAARHRVIGEATMVKLPNGRYLFALINTAGYIALRAFASDKLPPQGPAFIEQFLPAASEVLKHRGRSIELEKGSFPLLVTFDDLANPATVKRVDPFSLAELGGEYSIKSIRIEITDAAITNGPVRAVLGWLSNYPEPKLSGGDGRTTKIPFSRQITHGDFLRQEM